MKYKCSHCEKEIQEVTSVKPAYWRHVLTGSPSCNQEDVQSSVASPAAEPFKAGKPISVVEEDPVPTVCICEHCGAKVSFTHVDDGQDTVLHVATDEAACGTLDADGTDQLAVPRWLSIGTQQVVTTRHTVTVTEEGIE